MWVIVNPIAGGNRARRVWERISDLAAAETTTLTLSETRAPGHATELAYSALADGAKRVIVVGGDGTLQEVVAALKGSAVVLGVVPAGTGNDFARTHRIPRDPRSALRVALGGSIKAIDLGVVNERIFINVAGVGFDAEVAAWAKYRSRRFGGPVVYLAGVFAQLWAYSPQLLKYAVDRQPALEERCILIAVGNGRYYGGGMMICPEADAADGLFDVVIGGDLGKLETLRLLPKVFGGRHLGQPKVKTARGERVEISGPGFLTVHADGEPAGRLPAVFEILPRALLVAAPR